MDRYSLHFSERALSSMEQLDMSIRRRISRRIRWLADNVDDLTLEPLTGKFAGFFKLRVGDYRVIYEVVRERQAIVIYIVGHRRDVYR
jgi:mRNA interferase RelE/StbE